jgi:hypothetical protein
MANPVEGIENPTRIWCKVMKENSTAESEPAPEPQEFSVERLAGRVGARARAKSAFAEPIGRGSVTIVPVAKIR